MEPRMSRRKLLAHFGLVAWATIFLSACAVAQDAPKTNDKPPTEQTAPSDDSQQDDAPKEDDKAVPAESQDAEKKPDQNTDDGEAELEKAIELKSKAKTTRDLDEVVSVCESAIAKGLDETSTKLAEAMLKSTLLDHAKQLSQRILEGPRDSRWRFLRREALSRIEKVLKIDPKMADAHLMTARLEMLPGGDMTQARSALNRAIELFTNDNTSLSEALMLRAMLADDSANKLADLNQAIIIDESNTKALLVRAQHHSSNKDYDAAITDLRAAKDQGADAIELLVANLMESKQFDEANRELDEAIADDPKNSGLYLLQARIQSIQERPDEALAAVEKGLEFSTDKTEALLLKADILFDQKRVDEALETVESVLQDKSGDPEAMLLKSRILLDQKQFDEALTTVNSVLDLKPGLVSAIQLRSFIYAGQEKHDKAIAEMQKLVDFAPDQIGFQVNLAMFYNAAKKSDDAIKIYDRILEEDADLEIAVRGRADAFLSLGEHAKAIEDYERAIEIQDEKNEPDAGTVNNLAWVLATSPKPEIRDGKRSVELGLRACELSKYKESYAVSTLAAGYAETGDFEKAREWGAKAVALGEAEKIESLDNLRRELEGYQRNKPWRELLSEDLTGPEGEEVHKADLAKEKESAANDDEASDDKADPPKDKADKESDDKSEESTPDKSDDSKDG